jgi:hypothetical protein
MSATPGSLQGSPMPPGRAKQEGVRLLTGHFVGRAGELASLELGASAKVGMARAVDR